MLRSIISNLFARRRRPASSIIPMSDQDQAELDLLRRQRAAREIKTAPETRKDQE